MCAISSTTYFPGMSYLGTFLVPDREFCSGLWIDGFQALIPAIRMPCGIKYTQSFVKTVLWIAARLGRPQTTSWNACSQCAGANDLRREKECSHETIRNKNHHGNAAQRAGSVGDCGCAPALAQHGQVIYPQAPGLARNAPLRPMRKHILSADRSARKTVLLG